jgi:hypothetical protein
MLEGFLLFVEIHNFYVIYSIRKLFLIHVQRICICSQPLYLLYEKEEHMSKSIFKIYEF